MSSKANSTITSNFQPQSEGKPKQKASIGDATTKQKKDINSNTMQPGDQPGSRAKRRAASPQPGPSEKRQNTRTTSSSTQRHLSYTDLPPTWLTDSTPPQSNPTTLQLTYHKGDIFSTIPPNTLLIHACNTQGHWGAGIAKAFKQKYPKAYKAHRDFCTKSHNSKDNPVPTGTTQLLAPVPGDGGDAQQKKTWIGCVFTSAKYGKAKDKPDVILGNTMKAMEMLLELVKMAGEEGGGEGEGEGVEVIRMCKINSGKFGVPWERTEEVLQGIVFRDGWKRVVEVWEP